MTRDTRVQLVALAVLVACLFGSVAFATRLSGLAGRYKLVYTEKAEESGRWEVDAGIAMGAFRGVFVNYLWMRANDLKEAGKFYESNQLADAITKLQPRFPRVWVFHAWNLAYNISVQTSTPQERWDWVNRGVALLRDEGIPANPNDMLLHKELGWIFLHKIAGFTDDANTYYKRKLAEEWTIVLGPPPPSDPKDRSRAHAIDRFAARLEPIVNAPDTLGELTSKDPRVQGLLDRLRDLGVEKLDSKLLARYEISRAHAATTRWGVLQKGLDPRIASFIALVTDPTMKDAWDSLLPYVRKRVIVEQYHMEPERMQNYTRRYGPIDWRHPAAHGLYWAARGVEVSLPRFRGEVDRPDFDFINTDRVVVQSIQELFRTGEVYFDFLASVRGEYVQWLGAPNVHFIQAYSDSLDLMFDPQRTGIFQNRAARSFTTLWNGYENFIREAITFYYRRGEKDEADRWLTKLRTDARANLNDPMRVQKLSISIDQFVEQELAGEETRPSIAGEQIVGALMSAFANGLLSRDSEVFRNQFAFAAKAHAYYMKEQLRLTATSRAAGTERMAYFDPDFEIMAGQVFQAFLPSISLDDAETVYSGAPETLRHWAYDALKNFPHAALLAEEAKAGGRSFDAVFPPPPKHEEYVAGIRAKLNARVQDRPRVETK